MLYLGHIFMKTKYGTWSYRVKLATARNIDSLPSDQFIERLMVRDIEYSDKIELLKKSLLKLDSESRYENAIRKHYRGCMDYGFTVINDSAFEM